MVKLENLSVQYLHYFAQTKTAIYELNSQDYDLIHVGAQFKIKQNLKVKIGVRNLLNESFIDHLSRLKNIQAEAPGSNFYIGFKWQLIKNKDLHED